MDDLRTNAQGQDLNQAQLSQSSQDPDLLSRVALFKPKENSTNPDPKEIEFNPSDFDNIDSVEAAKDYAQKAYKSFEKGFQRKFQEIAELKKTLESNLSSSNGRKDWTTADVQDLLKDPTFIQAANGIIQSSGHSNSDDEVYSNLSEEDRREINSIKEQNRILLQQQNAFLQKQQDEMLKSRYPNYDAQAVDTITADLLKGKVQNTREYIWKAYDFENAIKRAYEMGRTDARQGINENVNVASYDGVSAAPSGNIKKEKNESNGQFMQRLYAAAIKSRKRQ